MNHNQEPQMREPEGETGSYEAQASSSAAPAQNDTMDAVDQRAATTKAQPMGRLGGEQREGAQVGATTKDGSSGLMQDQKWQYFAGRWDSIQAGFVDDPRRTVEQADRLVAEVIDHLSKIFRDERAKLEGQWSRSGKADTEDLRVAMQRYRDFFRTLVGR